MSFYTQRDAQYKDAPDSVFNYKKLPQNELEIQSYKDIIVAPSPTIKEVDGFKSEEEVTPTNEPSEEPSQEPSEEPSQEPSEEPTVDPDSGGGAGVAE